MNKKEEAIICDIDGTLALLDRDPYDASEAGQDVLNYPIAHILKVYDNQDVYDVKLVLLTGRMEQYRAVTEGWLKKHNITHYEALYMRPNDDFRKDYTVKREVYEQEIAPHFDVLFVLEDRNQVVEMWRDLGLTVLQVAEGKF